MAFFAPRRDFFGGLGLLLTTLCGKNHTVYLQNPSSARSDFGAKIFSFTTAYRHKIIKTMPLIR